MKSNNNQSIVGLVGEGRGGRGRRGGTGGGVGVKGFAGCVSRSDKKVGASICLLRMMCEDSGPGLFLFSAIIFFHW